MTSKHPLPVMTKAHATTQMFRFGHVVKRYRSALSLGSVTYRRYSHDHPDHLHPHTVRLRSCTVDTASVAHVCYGLIPLSVLVHRLAFQPQIGSCKVRHLFALTVQQCPSDIIAQGNISSRISGFQEDDHLSSLRAGRQLGRIARRRGRTPPSCSVFGRVCLLQNAYWIDITLRD